MSGFSPSPGDDDDDDDDDDSLALGFAKPKRVRNSSGGRKRASGCVPMGMFWAVGIMPVARSSAGSRTSIRMGGGVVVVFVFVLVLLVLVVGREAVIYQIWWEVFVRLASSVQEQGELVGMGWSLASQPALARARAQALARMR